MWYVRLTFYKLIKIVQYARSDWPRGVFAWEYVNMVVASRCFAFRALITQARIWKSFRVQNSTSLLYLPIPSSAETWKIVTKKVCQFFFRLSWQFKREKSVFWIASFCKTRTDYACKTSVQDFATGKNFSFNQCHNKEFCFFFSGKLFYKNDRKLFSCVCIASSSRVCITIENFSQPFECLYQAMQPRKTFSIA